MQLLLKHCSTDENTEIADDNTVLPLQGVIPWMTDANMASCAMQFAKEVVNVRGITVYT